MNDAKAVAEIRRLARRGRILITLHARQRMEERGVTYSDVTWAPQTATAAFQQADRDTWRIEGGMDIDGDDLTLICDVEADVIVVTVF